MSPERKASRPQTMEELEREIQHLASIWYPPRTEQELAIVAANGLGASLGRLPVVRGVNFGASSSLPSVAGGSWLMHDNSKSGT